MNNIKVAAAALNQIPLDWNGNYIRIIEAINLAVEQSVSLLCLPELCITGYSLEDMFFSREIHKKAIDYLNKIANYINDCGYDITVSVGLPFFLDGALYNVAALVNQYGILGLVPKQNLANDGVHYESRWFKPGPVGISIIVSLGDKTVDFGDLIFDFDGIKVGFEICEDLWVANRPGSLLAQKGVDIILNPSASHFAFGKHETREGLVVESSRAYKCTYVYSNLLGNEAGRVIFEGDTFIASGGKLIASGPRMSFKDIVLTTAIIDTDHTKTLQAMNGSFHSILADKSKDDYEVIRSRIPLTPVSGYNEYDNLLKAEKLSKYDEFIFAESLGLFDYMRKSHSNGYVISMSGGVDSAVCAALIQYMCRRGIKQLGEEKFIEKSELKLDSNKTIISQMLTCIYQGTENSSEYTLNAAKTASEGIGATFMNFNVNDIMNNYINLVQSNIGRELNWQTDDIALQNIQARIRVPGLWMIANIKQALLICTSNRSESAVGYCTADGDLSGSIAPLAGIDKAFLLEWIKEVHFWHTGNEGIDYYGSSSWTECLDLVVNSVPTAELRPAEDEQSDEKDLMNYEVLDQIERLAILEKKMPQEVLQSLLMDNPKGYTLIQLKEWTNKFFRLWQRNQFKRDKMPPSFMLDDECLDPKSWCRYPLLSAKFEEV